MQLWKMQHRDSTQNYLTGFVICFLKLPQDFDKFVGWTDLPFLLRELYIEESP